RDHPTVNHDEVIPKSVAADVSDVTFKPAPDEVVNRDPIVRYELAGLEPGGTLRIQYDIAVAPDGLTQDRLEQLVADQTAADETYQAANADARAPVILNRLVIDRTNLTIDIGGTATLSVSGEMSDGSPAPPAVLAAVVWRSADPSVASVEGGVVTAIAAG